MNENRTLTNAPTHGKGHGKTLVGEACDRSRAMWPTPSSSLVQDGESPETWLARREQLKAKGINGNGAGMPLTIASVLWATPTTRDWKDGACAQANVSVNGLLGRQVLTMPRTGSNTSRDIRLLNPRFVEALMGWPTGWSDCALSVTVSSHSKPLSPGAFSILDFF